MKTPKKNIQNQNRKQADLEKNISNPENQFLTTNQGVKINDNNNSLKSGERGPSLLEDFILREKITHFDHERIPERIVHARGSAAHGIFELYESQEDVTKAGFLNDTSIKTPVFVRFSTVAGSKGSTDLARDVRGFAVKFYTDEGIFDLVGNNIPVFSIQDAMKFPDFIHAVKPEPHHEIPQAASAHDTFWDFVSLVPETLHMVSWVMSDRGIPKSLRMMEGFGIHTFRLVNKDGKSSFVKFHWKPKLGVHSVCWDEATKISGKDPDFHRRDLWENIDQGNYPEWELGLQIVPEEDEFKFDFDLLDPTKLIPEEMVPVRIVGKMTLNKNPENFFAETEQVAFHPGHIVPGIDFTNDPLLQGRLFSYTDTQLSRLGSPNFHEIPINRSVAPVHNNQRDAHMRMTVNKGTTAYHPNSLGGGCPFQAMMKDGGFTSFPERIDAHKIRNRSESFSDHFSQPKLFMNSLTEHEKRHMIDAYAFELSKVNYDHVKERVCYLLNQIDKEVAKNVADQLGLEIPTKIDMPMNQNIGADENPKNHQPKNANAVTYKSDKLSITAHNKGDIKTRVIGILCDNNVNEDSLNEFKNKLEKQGASCKIIAPKGGKIKSDKGTEIKVDESFLTVTSVCFEAIFVPDGISDQLKSHGTSKFLLNETFKHCKAIAVNGNGKALLQNTDIPLDKKDRALLIDKKPEDFIKAIAAGRNWERELNPIVPA